MSEQSIPEMTADELRAISRKLSTYVELHPDDRDARSMANRCGEIASLLETPSADQRLRTGPGSDGFEDRVLRIASGAPLTRREIRSSRWYGSRWMHFGLSALLTVGLGFSTEHGKWAADGAPPVTGGPHEETVRGRTDRAPGAVPGCGGPSVLPPGARDRSDGHEASGREHPKRLRRSEPARRQPIDKR
jgi:hypothetical protein